MGTVLTRELDAYQRALEVYNRKLARHNAAGRRFNESVVRDQNGNVVAVAGTDPTAGNLQAVDSAGHLTGANLVPGFNAAQYGTSDIGSGYSMLRQHPTATTRETKTNVYKGLDEEGNAYYYEMDPTTGWDGGSQKKLLDGTWKIGKEYPGQQSYDGATPSTYDVYRDVNTYPENPGEWKGSFDMKAPDATFSQIKRAGSPTLSDMEAGLIGEVLAGKGLR